MTPFDVLDPLAIAILALLVVIGGVGRLARIITYDDFPPSVWWRIRWAKWNRRKDGTDGSWTKLFTCFWCLSPWIMAVAIAWYWWGTLWYPAGVAWWVFWSWLALSYAAAILVRHDEHE